MRVHVRMYACTHFRLLRVKENLLPHIITLFPAVFFPALTSPIPLFSQSLGWQKAREVGGGENGKESANRKAGFHRKSKKCSWVHEAHEGGKPDLLYFPRNHVICSSLTYGHRYSNRRSRFLLFSFSFSVTSIHLFRYTCLSVLTGPIVCVTEYLRQVWQCSIYNKLFFLAGELPLKKTGWVMCECAVIVAKKIMLIP